VLATINILNDPEDFGSPYKSMQVVIFIDFWHSAAPNFAALMA